MLDGTKLFVSGAGTAESGADFGVVTARTESASGEGLGVARFVVEVDRPGVQRWRPYQTLAVGRDTQELNLSNVRLPPANLLGEAEDGLTRVERAWVRRDVFVAAGLVGVGEAAQAMVRERARGGGAGESGRWAVADGQTLLAAARGLVQRAADPAWTLGDGTPGSTAEVDAAESRGVAARAAQARQAAQAAAMQVVDGAITTLGPAALSTDLPLERWFRELRVLQESDGGPGRLRETTAGYLLSTYGP